MIKKSLKFIINKLGYQIIKKQNHLNLVEKLNSLNIDIIFDIGANKGQSAIEFFSKGFKGRIVSFEPLSEEHKELELNSKKYKNWIVAPRMAIGDKDGQVNINVSGNSGSSSILPISETHTNAAPDSAYVGVQKVEIKRLDSISEVYTKTNDKFFIKIDTQGFEYQVLNGGSNILKNTIGLKIELSLVLLYEGQILWKELIEKINKMGFELWQIEPGFSDFSSGKMLQIDAIFFRK